MHVAVVSLPLSIDSLFFFFCSAAVSVVGPLALPHGIRFETFNAEAATVSLSLHLCPLYGCVLYENEKRHLNINELYKF